MIGPRPAADDLDEGMPIAEHSFVPEILRALDAQREEAGWGRPPELFVIQGEALAESALAVTVAEFPAWDIMVAMTEHVVPALHGLTRVWQTCASAATPKMPGLLGLVLTDETWHVAVSPGDPSPTVPPSEHPDRIEQRFVWFLGVDGSQATLTRARGGDPTRNTSYGWTGRVLLALAALLHAVQEAQP